MGPAGATWPEIWRVLSVAWGAKECRDVAGRRADMAHIALNIDRYASTRLLRSNGLAADATGALRTVMAGGT
eukprot:3468017-Lingulodinium_polyedra.AAC.1